MSMIQFYSLEIEKRRFDIHLCPSLGKILITDELSNDRFFASYDEARKISKFLLVLLPEEVN